MITKNVSIDQTIAQVEGNLVSDMGGEKVMLSVKNGKYYNLGEVGGRIWDLIQTEESVKQIVESLLAEFHVEKSECEVQVFSFLELLLEEGLIEIKD